jgi:hypothetical protein
MKTGGAIRRCWLAGAAFALAVSAGAHARKVDFREFAGLYRGTYTLTAPPSTFFGNVDVTVTVPASGKRMTVRTAGYVLEPSSGNLLSFLGDVTLTSSRTVSATNLLFAFAAQVPATGSYSVKRKNVLRITMSGIIAGKTLTGTYTLRLRKRSLVVTGTAVSAGDPPLVVSILARRR